MRYALQSAAVFLWFALPTVASGQEAATQATKPDTSQDVEAVWTPPRSPVPDGILDEAEQDAGRGRHAEALAKHIWFHEHALEFDESQYGVRLSFALTSWNELAKVYPPAKQALLKARDKAKAAVLDKKDPRHAFHDLQSINATIEQQTDTVEVFKTVRSREPKLAKGLFDIAVPDLIRAKEYRLCGDYLEPEAQFRQMSKLYEENLKLGQQPEFGDELLQYAEDSFLSEASTLVALLVVNDRAEEANGIADQARKVWDSPKLQKALDEALKGVVPPPWP